MCEYVDRYKLDGILIQTRYKVIAFHSESETDWLFEVEPIEQKRGYGKWEPHRYAGKREHRAFMKKKLIRNEKKRDGKDVRSVPVYQMLPPPRFYNDLRNKAIDEGRLKVQGDDMPEEIRFRKDWE